MARVNTPTVERKNEIMQFVERWEDHLEVLEDIDPKSWTKHMPFKLSLKMLRELLGE